MNKFTAIKDFFLTTDNYINLTCSNVAYNKLLNAINSPIKLAVLYGEAGSGKSFLMQKIYDENGLEVLYFPQPFFGECEFYREIFLTTCGKECDFKDFNEFLKYCKVELNNKKQITVMLDEASFYPPTLLDKIRLLADTMLFKFILAVHKNNYDCVLEKEYFKSRIWDFIKLEPLHTSSVALYIEKKMQPNDSYQKCAKFKDEHFELITQLSGGNLRMINKIMYKFFEICEYYEQNNPEKNSGEFIDKQVILMAGIACGVLNA